MSNPCLELFEYSLGLVSPDDIAAFCPSDPGYPDYVRTFTEILTTRRVPEKGSFEVSETLELTLYEDADTERNPERFRRFRTFTNAVGLAMSLGTGLSANIFLAPIEYLKSLEADSSAMSDIELSRLVNRIRAWADAH
jgi:hypothetical protein